ncbi:unnamed protein product [Prorocentrum cordatum]|uniref:Uncharacterized protein n=1 Tax=Prorocentrum cordatum TaxID=2364126 RepID=A0ABN9QUX3_9DINO|nr:unnamed protein product [Polarella glacialis]
MSQSAVFVLLRRACDAHPLQLGSVLRVLGHMLELLPCAGREVDERGEEEEEVVLEDRQDVWRSGVAGGGGLPGDAEMGSPQLARVRRMIAASLAYLAAAPDGCMQVLEFVRAHEGQWGGEELRLFLADLLPCIAPPYSVRFVSAVARLLDRPAAWAFGGGEDAAAKELPSIAGRFAEDCRRCLEELPQETQTALAAVEARLAGRALSEATSPPKHQIGVDAVGLVPAAVSDATVVAPTGQAPAEPDADELMGLELWSWWNRKKGAAKVAPKPQEGPLTLKPMKSKGKRTRAPSARPGRRRHAEGNSDDCDEDSDPNQGAAPRAPAAAVPRLRRARTASRRLSPGVDEDDDAEEEFDFSRSARAAASGPPPACPGPRVARSRSRGAGGSGSDTESVRQPSEDCAAEPPTAECSRGSGGRQQAATAPPATAQPRAGGLWDSAERSGAERTAVPPGQPGGAGDGALASRARKVKRLAFHSMLAGAPAAAPGPTALAEPPSFSSNTSPTVGRSPTPGTAASPRARPAATAAAGPAARDAASSAQARAASGVTAEPSAPMVPGAAAMPVCPWVGGEDSGIRLDAELMQGTWLHSYGGEVTVVGAAVMWKGNQLGDLVAQPGGVFELAGWVADPGRSSPDRVLWTHPSLPVCCWDRPNAQKDSAE